MDDLSNPMNADKDDEFSLIDGSELDDLFVSMSEPRFMDNKVNSVDGKVNVLGKTDAERHRKNEKYNLRKSLAWDSAFFTNAGVLDAEELSIIIDGSNVGKHEMQHLPGIEEDVSKSTDSLSTFESDSMTLESLEADLFSDIRASIQRSGNTSKMQKSNLNGKLEETSHLGKKTAEIKHGNMVKPKSTPKKLIANLPADVKLSKLGPSHDHMRKPMATRRESTSSFLKPAATNVKESSLGKVPVKLQAKRMSVYAGRIKPDASNVGNVKVAGRVTTVSKGDRPCDSRSNIPKTVPSAKSSSGLSTNNRTGVSSARNSCDSTTSSLSVGSRILPLNGLQGKIRHPVSIPPGKKSTVPSRGQLKGKQPPNTFRVSAKLSASMLSPSVSPSSSISEWSSSSSNVYANQEHSVSNDCSSLHRTISLDSIASEDSQMHPKQAVSENELAVGRLPCISAQGLSTGNESVSDPVSAKPSGLRMPSPKIGFFDGVKLGGRNQNTVSSMQSRSHLSSSRLPRSTNVSTSPSGVQNKGRIEHSYVKTTANANPDAQRGNARKTTTGEGCQDGTLTAPRIEQKCIASGDTLETPLPKTSVKNNYLSAMSPVRVKHHSDRGSSRKKIGLASPSKNASPDGISHCEGNQVSIGVNADCHPMEINVDTTVLNPLALHKLINEDTIITELHPVIISEMRNTSKGDEHVDPVVVKRGGHEEGTEKNNPVCALVIGKKSTVFDPVCMTEEVCNAFKVGANADPVAVNGFSEEPKENIGPISAVVTDQESAALNPLSMSEVVCSSIKVDENDDPVVGNEGLLATNEKKDRVCDVITVQKSIFVDLVSMSEELHDVYHKIDENADQVVANVRGEATNDKHDPICAVFIDQQNPDTVRDAYQDVNKDPELPLNGLHEAANEKNDQICDVVADQKNTFVDPVSMSEEVCTVYDPIGVVVTKQNSFIDPVSMFEEVCSAVKIDESADHVGVNGCNETNDPINATVIDQPSAFLEPASPSEKVYDATTSDEIADHMAADGVHEVTNEKNNPICDVVSDQQTGLVEQQVNRLIENVEALGKKRELCDEIEWNSEIQSKVDSESGSHSPAVLFTSGISGSYQKTEAADLTKQIDLPVFLKNKESNPGSRMPFSDKNSLPDTSAMDILLKSFSSLSLDNVNANDGETRTT